MFYLSQNSLEHLNLKQDMLSDEAGGFACFEGWVRNHNEGKKVIALEYEAFDQLCQTEAQKIFNEVRQKFDILKMKCVHRIGRLNIGEMAVWVGVSAPHRDDAFKACRYIIDEIKKRLPIWKKEYYENGDSGWVGCAHEESHDLSKEIIRQ